MVYYSMEYNKHFCDKTSGDAGKTIFGEKNDR